jgi:uncharacterized membrane protein required for colicin V production
LERYKNKTAEKAVLFFLKVCVLLIALFYCLKSSIISVGRGFIEQTSG